MEPLRWSGQHQNNLCSVSYSASCRRTKTTTHTNHMIQEKLISAHQRHWQLLRSRLAIFIVMLAGSLELFGSAPTSEKALMIWSTSIKMPTPSITINFPMPPSGGTVPVRHCIYRRTSPTADWGPKATVTWPTAFYKDASVDIGSIYEYRVRRYTSETAFIEAYVSAGVEASPVHSRGKVILLVDATYATSLTSELSQLEDNLVGDGWVVLRRDVPRETTVRALRSLIKSIYDLDTAATKSLLIFGHLAVPYSGNLVAPPPDGHVGKNQNDDPVAHIGAWATDAFYADLDSVVGPDSILLSANEYPSENAFGSSFRAFGWSDGYVQITNADRPENSNSPGDGKFDQNRIPSTPELAVGRVDLVNLPAFLEPPVGVASMNDVELLRRYLKKNNRYRRKGDLDSPDFSVPQKGLIVDRLLQRDGIYTSLSSWSSFTSLFGSTNITELSLSDSMLSPSGQGHIWTTSSDRSSFNGHLGYFTTSDYVTKTQQTVFVGHYGSYFGDWNTENNFLRSALASASYTLASAWLTFVDIRALRPWTAHQMGIGEPIGTVIQAFQTQNLPNQDRAYFFEYGGAGPVYVSLMGDPTLRLHTVAPVSNLSGSRASSSSPVILNWTASPDSGLSGYFIYRSTSRRAPFTLVNTSPVIGNSYTTPAGNDSSYVYMVRAAKLEITPGSGSYFNLSEGSFITISLNLANRAPVISKQPLAIRVRVGAPAAFSVEAYGEHNGSSSLTYQWNKNGTNIAGATSPYFVIPSVNSGDAASYTVTVANSTGSITSTAAALAVNQIPIAAQDSIAVAEGGTVDVPVFANDSDPDSAPQALQFLGVSRLPLHGTVSVIPGNPILVHYVNDATLGYTPTDTFTYAISDGEAIVEGRVVITITDASINQNLTSVGLKGQDQSQPSPLPNGAIPGGSRMLPDGSWALYSPSCPQGANDPCGTSNPHFETEARSGDAEVWVKLNDTENQAGVSVGMWQDPSFGSDTPTPWGVECYNQESENYLFLGGPGVQAEFSVKQPQSAWIGLKREGNTFTAFRSIDGVRFEQSPVSSIIQSPTTDYRLGLCIRRRMLNSFGKQLPGYASISEYGVNQTKRSFFVRLRNPSFNGSAFSFTVSGFPVNTSCDVQYSVDNLKTWQTLQTIYASSIPEDGTSAVVTDLDPFASGATARSYRLKWGSRYSYNSLGIVKAILPAGVFTYVSNPFSGTQNTISTMFASAATGTIVSHYDQATQAFINHTKAADGSWSPSGDREISAGEALMVKPPAASVLTQYFLGELKEGSVNQAIPAAVYSAKSLVGPLSGSIDWFSHPLIDGDAIMRWNSSSSTWDYFGQEANSAWDPSTPILGKAEGLLVYSGSGMGRSWNRLQSAVHTTLNGAKMTPSGFSFQIHGGTMNAPISVQASADLNTWTVLNSSQITGPDPIIYTDSAATGMNFRFYRVVENGLLASLNVVGFSKATIPGRTTATLGGFALVTDPFLSSPNTLDQVLPDVPQGTIVRKWNEAGQTFTEYTKGVSSWSPNGNLTIQAGESFFVRSPTTTPFTLYFVGDVSFGNLNTPIPSSSPSVIAYRSSRIPRAGALTALGYPLADGDLINKWNPSTQQFNQYEYIDGEGWTPSEPTLGVGEGIVIQSGSATKRSWTQYLKSATPTP